MCTCMAAHMHGTRGGAYETRHPWVGVRTRCLRSWCCLPVSGSRSTRVIHLSMSSSNRRSTTLYFVTDSFPFRAPSKTPLSSSIAPVTTALYLQVHRRCRRCRELQALRHVLRAFRCTLIPEPCSQGVVAQWLSSLCSCAGTCHGNTDCLVCIPLVHTSILRKAVLHALCSPQCLDERHNAARCFVQSVCWAWFGKRVMLQGRGHNSLDDMCHGLPCPALHVTGPCVLKGLLQLLLQSGLPSEPGASAPDRAHV